MQMSLKDCKEGLRLCTAYGSCGDGINGEVCPYKGYEFCNGSLMHDALEHIKRLEELNEDMVRRLEYYDTCAQEEYERAYYEMGGE